MPPDNKVRVTINYTFMLALTVQLIAGLGFLIRMDGRTDKVAMRVDLLVISVERMVQSLEGIRGDFKAVQDEIRKLDVRASRLEEAMRIRRESADSYLDSRK